MHVGGVQGTHQAYLLTWIACHSQEISHTFLQQEAAQQLSQLPTRAYMLQPGKQKKTLKLLLESWNWLLQQTFNGIAKFHRPASGYASMAPSSARFLLEHATPSGTAEPAFALCRCM